jgi:YHS domain-containing protein
MRIVTVALVLGLLASACGGSAHTSARPPALAKSAQADIKPPGAAKIGDRTRCIVSGDVFTVTADSPHAEYQGKTYYFCCPDCPEAFSKDPQKYVKGV